MGIGDAEGDAVGDDDAVGVTAVADPEGVEVAGTIDCVPLVDVTIVPSVAAAVVVTGALFRTNF